MTENDGWHKNCGAITCHAFGCYLVDFIMKRFFAKYMFYVLHKTYTLQKTTGISMIRTSYSGKND
jgi:hypothetical protein